MPPESAPARRAEKRSSWTQIGAIVSRASATVVSNSEAKKERFSSTLRSG